MHIYLPVADMSANLVALLALGGAVGLISGLFGVGGGFLLTPLLIMSGVPPAIAVASQAPQIVAAAVSAGLAYLRRGCVDFGMGGLLLIGGLVGSWLGVRLFAALQAAGQVEFVVTALYVVLLGGVGGLMTYESWGAARARDATVEDVPRAPPAFFRALPMRRRFVRSGVELSVLPPIAIGFGIGLLGAVMGVGGGFIMVPAMIYFLGMPTPVAVGTSLLQVALTMSATTLLHAIETGSVDALLALILILGGALGAQLGAVAGQRLRAPQLRLGLALVILSVGAALAADLLFEPSERYSLAEPVQ